MTLFPFGKVINVKSRVYCPNFEVVTSTLGYLLKTQPKLNHLLKIAANDMERKYLMPVTNLCWPGLRT
jgi:hypothetical protein